MLKPRIPSATYRLQFNRHFTFRQALGLIDYFYELGISDCYASPIQKAQPGSLHGYDVVDYSQVNPEIGTEEEYGQFAEGLRHRQMGLVQDIVPNHMCVADATNRWWNDVLENGPSSLYANHFNIIWDPPKNELKNKVLLAVLDQQYGRVIESGDFKIVYEGGSFFLDYRMRRFPVNPRTWNVILEPVVKRLEKEIKEESDPDLLELQSIMTALAHLPGTSEIDPEKIKELHREKEIVKKRLANLLDSNESLAQMIEESLKDLNGVKGNPRSFDRLEELLNEQSYRLSYWRVTNDEINYRRFFDISDLASMRVEEQTVFDDIHELVLSFVKREWVTGFRIDHVDGLFDPQQYLYHLQKACRSILEEKEDDAVSKSFYVIVEKILEGTEELRSHWLVYGTTGYDYLNLANGVCVVKENKQALQHIYDHFIDRHENMTRLIYACKNLILQVSMASELYILARQLAKISEQHRWSKDFTLETLRLALKDVVSCFRVYRSYIRLEDETASEEDRHYILDAIQNAKKFNPASESSVFDFIENVLLLQHPEGLTESQIAYRKNFVMRFQQITGPVMAKGFEDTAYYRMYPLASLNEVGMDPDSFGVDIETFHQKNQERLEKWPHTLLATFTHDTKRSEDVRARINVLSEKPALWEQALYRWRDMNADKKTQIDHTLVPDANEEYLFYQTLIGTWPFYPMDASAYANYVDRIEKYMIKAIKEAKLHTSWINPNEQYENGVRDFVRSTLNLDPKNSFIKDLKEFSLPIMRAGIFNSLMQLTLKMTVPGIPDFYQGSELWEFTLVDPDNRSPVDYSNRKYLLASLKELIQEDLNALVTHLIDNAEDGRIKLFVTSQGLNFRRENAALFLEGSYIPLYAFGEKSSHLIAFSRAREEQSVIVMVGRFYSQLMDPLTLPVGDEVWKDTRLNPPEELWGHYQDVLTNAEYRIGSEGLAASSVFSKLPLAVLKKISTEKKDE
jgi:(1->4)-alpha-D-glucan 1-alpha-D-glucosylmutase